MKRYHKDKEIKIFKKIKFIVKSLYFLVFVLCALQIIVSNSLTSSGEKISKINNESEKLRYENKLLEEDIAKINSIYVLTSKAKEIGFVKSTTTMVISPMVPIAQNRIN